MAKIPRDLDADNLIRILFKIFDYKVTRQTGSHIRLSTEHMGTIHSITIPNHSPIKIGTLNKILSDIANYMGISKNNLITKIF